MSEKEKAHVLVADDSKDWLEAFVVYLKSAGFDACGVETGAGLQTKLEQRPSPPWHALVVDNSMPMAEREDDIAWCGLRVVAGYQPIQSRVIIRSIYSREAIRAFGQPDLAGMRVAEWFDRSVPLDSLLCTIRRVVDASRRGGR